MTILSVMTLLMPIIIKTLNTLTLGRVADIGSYSSTLYKPVIFPPKVVGTQCKELLAAGVEPVTNNTALAGQTLHHCKLGRFSH
jgi:hypothetical protein